MPEAAVHACGKRVGAGLEAARIVAEIEARAIEVEGLVGPKPADVEWLHLLDQVTPAVKEGDALPPHEPFQCSRQQEVHAQFVDVQRNDSTAVEVVDDDVGAGRVGGGDNRRHVHDPR